MNCRNCGQQVPKGSRFCSSCGSPIELEDNNLHNQNETPVNQSFNEEQVVQEPFEDQVNQSLDRENEKNEENEKAVEPDESLNLIESRKAKRDSQKQKKWWLLPILSAVLAIGSIAGTYIYMQVKTQKAMNVYKQGESLALKGDYKKAADSFNQTLKLKPNFPSAKNNLQVVSLAIATEKNLSLANSLEKKGNYEQALSTLSNSIGQLTSYKGALIKVLNQSLSESRMKISVKQLRQEMKGKKKVEELAPILQKAENLKIPEATQIATEIRSEIADYAYNQANTELQNNHFTQVTQLIESGLKYAPSNKKLKALKSIVAQKKKEFEKAVQAKIEHAMVAAAKEKANNQTNAIKLLDLNTSWDMYGDLVIKGTVQSIATVPISDVSLNYTITDSNGKELDSGQVYIDQNILYPGDQSTFEVTNYYITANQYPSETVNASITGASWYLQN